jgi:hypothetical protein
MPRKKQAKSKPSGKASKARRRRSAVAAVKKDTTILQTDQGTKLVWGGNQPRPQKV